jgi:hypothetical protein
VRVSVTVNWSFTLVKNCSFTLPSPQDGLIIAILRPHESTKTLE